MSIRSDSLLSVSGVLPAKLAPKHVLASTKVPDAFAARLAKWTTLPQQPFKAIPPLKDMDRLFDKLAAELDQDEVAVWLEAIGPDDPELSGEYLDGISRARDYLVAKWPRVVIDDGMGPEVLPPAFDDELTWTSIYAVLDDSERLLDELEAWTLTPEQALAFRVVFPSLHGHVIESLKAAAAALRAKGQYLGWERLGQLRILQGLEPEAQPLPPPPAPPAPARAKWDPAAEATHGQITEKPRDPEARR
ncbi:MAG TPA: hypothetical protein VFV05_15570 [Methylomirabilota bacterium]|nr:hypothetical protein [Methylomirabilota bacterium]